MEEQNTKTEESLTDEPLIVIEDVPTGALVRLEGELDEIPNETYLPEKFYVSRKQAEEVVWRKIEADWPVINIVFSKGRAWEELYNVIKIDNPKISLYLNHLIKERIVPLKDHLTDIYTEEIDKLEKEQKRSEERINHVINRNNEKKQEALVQLGQFEIEYENILKELRDSDESASEAAGKIGIFLTNKPIIDIELLEKKISRNEPKNPISEHNQDEEFHENELEETNKDEGDSIPKKIIDGLMNLAKKSKDSVTNFYDNLNNRLKELFQKEKQVYSEVNIGDNLKWNRIIENLPHYLVNLLYRVPNTRGVASRNNFPVYEDAEVLFEKALTAEQKELTQAQLHRHYLLPLIPDKLFHVFTVGVGMVLGLSIAFVILPEEQVKSAMEDISEFLKKAPVFLTIGTAIAYASRYAITASFSLVGEKHGLYLYHNDKNPNTTLDKNNIVKSLQKFTFLAFLTLIFILVVEYSVELSGILTFNEITEIKRRTGGGYKNQAHPMAKNMMPLVFMSGYLFYCAYEGFLRGRNTLLFNRAIMLSEEKWDSDLKSRGVEYPIVLDSVIKINLYLSKIRTLSVIKDNIERIKLDLIVYEKDNEDILAKNIAISFNDIANRRINHAYSNLIAATKKFDELLETVWMKERVYLLNEIKKIDLDNEKINLEKNKLGDLYENIVKNEKASLDIALNEQQRNDKKSEHDFDLLIKRDKEDYKYFEKEKEISHENFIRENKLTANIENEKNRTQVLSEEIERAKNELEVDKLNLEREKIKLEIHNIKTKYGAKKKSWFQKLLNLGKGEKDA